MNSIFLRTLTRVLFLAGALLFATLAHEPTSRAQLAQSAYWVPVRPNAKFLLPKGWFARVSTVGAREGIFTSPTNDVVLAFRTPGVDWNADLGRLYQELGITNMHWNSLPPQQQPQVGLVGQFWGLINLGSCNFPGPGGSLWHAYVHARVTPPGPVPPWSPLPDDMEFILIASRQASYAHEQEAKSAISSLRPL